MTRDIAQRFNHTLRRAEVFTLPEPHILEDVAVVPGVDGRKMSKSYDNTMRMFWPQKQLKKAVMSDRHRLDPGRGAEGHRSTVVFQLWSLFADAARSSEEMFARARSRRPGLRRRQEGPAEAHARRTSATHASTA